MSSLVALLDRQVDALGPLRYLVYAFLILVMILISKRKRFLTTSGLIAAAICGFMNLYIGGFSSFVILLFFFLAGSVLSKAMKREIKSEKKGCERDATQVLANCIASLFALFLYKLTPYKEAALIAYASSLAEALSDTFSGDFGMLSDRDPVSIVTFTKVPKGISGGVTMLGFMGGLLGSFLIALLYEGTYQPSFFSLFLITISGFLGSVLDSLLGAVLQVHYRDRDGLLTEKDHDENGPFERARGVPFIDNDMVNFLSSLFSFSISFFIASIVI